MCGRRLLVKGCKIFSSNECFVFLNNLTHNHKMSVCLLSGCFCRSNCAHIAPFVQKLKNSENVILVGLLFYSANMFLFLK